MQAWLAIHPEEGRSLTNEDVYGGELPDIDPVWSHLPEILREIGTGLPSFNGLAPLTWGEIQSWCDAQQHPLTPFESQALRLMSTTYCGIASDRESSCPVESEDMLARIDTVGIESWLMLAEESK